MISNRLNRKKNKIWPEKINKFVNFGKKGILPQFGPLRSRDGERQLFRKSKDIRTNISGVLIIHFKGLEALFLTFSVKFSILSIFLLRNLV